MKAGTRVRIVDMPEGKREFVGRCGVVTSWKPGSSHIGVMLDGDYREVALFIWQVKRD